MSERAASVLIVDDDPFICRLIEDVLSSYCLRCRSVHTGAEAEGILRHDRFDVAVLDLCLPDLHGLDLLETIRRRDDGMRVVCITGGQMVESSGLAQRAGAWEFLRKPFDIGELAEVVTAAAAAAPGDPRARSRFNSQSRQMLLEFGDALVRAVEAKDPYTRRHSEHVAFYAENLARHIGLPRGLQEAIRLAALLHDIGKIAVPDSILTKPGRLTAEEFAFIRQHPITGADILKQISLMEVEALFIRHHHENWDGSGYPAGTSGEAIPVGGRILNVADSIDAMLMCRTYKRGYSVERMLGELERCSGTQFDPEIGRVALSWCQRNRDALILTDTALAAAIA